MSFKKAFVSLRQTKPPKGWSSLEEVATDLGCSRRNAQEKLRVMLEQGLVERKGIMIYREDGRASQCSYFRLVKK